MEMFRQALRCLGEKEEAQWDPGSLGGSRGGGGWVVPNADPRSLSHEWP